MQATVDRIQRSRELHAWKQDTAFARSFTGRQRQGGDEEVLLQASTARFTPDGRLMYVLRDDRVGGLYQQDLHNGEEKRLVHRQNFVLDDLTPSADGTRLASQRASNGSANICLMAIDGSGYRELTGGDTVDSAPAWVSNDGDGAVPDLRTGARAQRTGTGSWPGLDPVAGHRQRHGHAGAGTMPTRISSRTRASVPRASSISSVGPTRRHATRVGTSCWTRWHSPFRILRALFHYLNLFFSLRCHTASR